MKSTVLALSTLLLALSQPVLSFEQKNGIWSYQKADGQLMLKDKPNEEQVMQFFISTNVDTHLCEVEGDARVIADNENHVTLQWYDEDACQITIVSGRAISYVSASDQCNNYCGLKAGRSINGVYQ